jgi:two-component system, OmpR family, sensor histidine kinase KdpD
VGLEPRRLAAVVSVAAETVVFITAASLLVAALDRIAPIAGLSVVYLLAVLAVAIRSGEVAALATAVLSVLTMNFLYIEPKHRLTIADSGNVAALVVFLIVAVVVGRLASRARQRARESEARARIADARERESKLLAASRRPCSAAANGRRRSSPGVTAPRSARAFARD